MESSALQVTPDSEESGDPVHLQIPLPHLSSVVDGQQMYHFAIIGLAYEIREYLAIALRSKSYRLSEDATYIDGRLHFRVVNHPEDLQIDQWEANRIYLSASEDIGHALHYLDDPVATVTSGLEAGRPKAEFHSLYSAAADLVDKNEQSPISAAVVHGSEKVSVTGTIAKKGAHRIARRNLNPPVAHATEFVTITFKSRDSDGVLISDQGDRYDPGPHHDRIRLGHPTRVKVQTAKTRISRDVQLIISLATDADDEDSDE